MLFFKKWAIKFLMLFAGLAIFLGSVCETRAAEPSQNKADWPSHLRLVTGPEGGQWFVLGEAIAGVFSREVLNSTSRMGGGLSNIGALNERTADIGFTLASFLGAAESDEPEYKTLNLNNTTLLARIYPQVLYVIIHRDFAEKNGIESVGQMFEKNIPLRFASLKKGTASEFILSLLLQYGYQTSFNQLREKGWEIIFCNYTEAADDFASGAVDCFAYTAGEEVPLILTIEKYANIKILPVEKNVLENLAERFKTYTYTIPTGVYSSVKAPVQTLGDYTCLVVRKDLPPDLVFAMSKSLWENKDYLASIVKDYKKLSSSSAVMESLPMHPGAIEFWTSAQSAK